MNVIKGKKIGIDARLFGHHARGIGRYTWQLIHHLKKIGQSSNRYFIFLKKEDYQHWEPENKRFTKILADAPLYSFAEQTVFCRKISSLKLDLMHFPHYNVPLLYRGPFVVTIHDLLLHRFPGSNASTRHPFLFWGKYLAYRFVMREAICRAQSIIAVTHFTKNELRHFYPKALLNIKVIYEGVSSLELRPAVRPSIQLPKKRFILYVGAAYPHKNLKATIETLAPYLKKNNLIFVLAGRIDYFYLRLQEWIKQRALDELVVCMGEVPDSELGCLYKTADIFLMPSLYEGFGLPPLEAMVCGCPVIVSQNGSLPEVLGNAALFYSSDSGSSLIDAVSYLMEDSTARNKFIERGFRLIKKYSWSALALETEKLYNDVDVTQRKY